MKPCGFNRKPHIFFLNDGFSETLTRNLWFHVFGGSKIETKGGFIETRGFDWGRGRRPLPQSNTPGFNEYHLWVSIFDTPKNVKSTDFLSKFSMNTVIWNKKNMWGFIWNLILAFLAQNNDLNTNFVQNYVSINSFNISTSNIIHDACE